MTKEKNKEWAISVVLIAFVLTHAYCYVYWPDYEKINIYYISLYAMIYAMSTAMSFLAKHKVLKMVLALMLSASGYFLYLEFLGNPTDWSFEQKAVGAFVLLNGLMLSLIIEKIKK